MFYECNNLTTFTSDLSSLTSGEGMFCFCENLTTFNVGDLSSLTNGNSMFNECHNLTTFTSNMSSLTDGTSMFGGCKKLTTFSSDLSSLTDGNSMFNECHNLTTFDADLSSLTNGTSMFYGCTNLTSFNSKLSSLKIGHEMFGSCKLDASSVKNIIDTIKTAPSNGIWLGMGCDNNTEDKDLFAQEIGYNTMTELLSAFNNKGWPVTAQYNGRPTTTYTLRKPQSLPVFVKLEEVILPSEEEIALAKENGERIMPPHYEYTSEDGSKLFNISWFHETTGSTEGYTQFNSIEEAIETFNIKQVERN